MIRILLADDHCMVREALRDTLAKIPDVDVVAEAGDAHSAIEKALLLAPDIVVMDMSLPDLNGAEAVRLLKKAGSTAAIVALSAYSDRRVVVDMVRAGAGAYVIKSAAATELVRAIRAVAAGQNYFSPEVASALISEVRAPAPKGQAPHLARREREVLRLIADGVRSHEIAQSLHISLSTVEVYRRNIMRKLDLHTIAELTKHAIRQGITSI